MDCWVEKILRDSQMLGKLGRRKPRPVVAGHKRSEEIPYFAAWMRKVNVAAPNPMAGTRLTAINQRSGLRVVDDHKFSVQRQPRAIFLVALKENVEVAGSQAIC